jgi:SNF2-related domain
MHNLAIRSRQEAAQGCLYASKRCPHLMMWRPMLQGHKVKNAKTKLVQALHTVPAGVRVILSGTPIQNNLGEMHALYDFACEVCLHTCALPLPGRCLEPAQSGEHSPGVI